jgi:hypothetical protein
MAVKINILGTDPVGAQGTTTVQDGIDPGLLRQMRQAAKDNSDTTSFSEGAEKKERFSIFGAAKQFFKGTLRPIATMLKHPFMTAGALAATVAVASFAPVVIPIMVLAGLALGGKQILGGVKNAVSEYQAGNYGAAEKAFGDIGEGAFTFGTSALGVRTGGAIAAEARATNSALKTATTAADKVKAVEAGLDAAVKVRQGGWFNALKENVKLVTSREGWQASWSQLNPRNVVSNFRAIGKETVRMFKEKPTYDVNKAVSTAQKHLGIADKDMPTVVQNLKYEHPVLGELDMTGRAAAFYNPKTHSIHVEPDGFKFAREFVGKVSQGSAKLMDKLPQSLKNFVGNAVLKKYPPDQVMIHEMTHSRQALPIQRLTQAQAEAVLKSKGITSEYTLKEDLNVFKFAAETQKLSPDELAASEKALWELYQGIKAAQEMIPNLFSGKGIRPYVASAAEIEARQQAALFNKNVAINTLENGGNLTAAESTHAFKNIRGSVIEERLNQTLVKLNELEAAQAPAAEIAAQEELLRGTSSVFGGGSMTKDMVNQDLLVRKYFKGLPD